MPSSMIARHEALAWTPPEISRDRPPLSQAQYEDLLGILGRGDVENDDDDDLERLVDDTLAKYDARDAALKRLKLIGRGMSRAAYFLDVEGHPPMVLKVALDDDDSTFQNETEVLCAIEAARSPLLPRVYAWGPSEDPFDPGGFVRWIVVEYLWPAYAPDLTRLTGVSPRQLKEILTGDPDRVEERLRAASETTHVGGAAFLHELAQLIEVCDLAPGDLRKDEHWGIDAQGNFKLIDFGFRRTPGRTQHPASR